jgi:hypothetical protein
MMLPFLLGTMAIWYGVRGRRDSSALMWVLALIVFVLWCRFHMTDPLNFSL